ncbi:hypothetical protein GYMLUDRAFT_64632 [Collybiopsis luxurians FD-317 M1]|uniref:Unplaced genomic scaffold GYMLUscaffold_107, whole genome shotgun sequence n=1 Tax=Collybiopsis luxurians FD-317 M1 TaxID=944289 RepID=A0A0D0ANF3_9AGAR|nr:hypothetical protein GYMLUDRAFT_64632 [Collybiopsis luxurians FD-317 M1]
MTEVTYCSIAYAAFIFASDSPKLHHTISPSDDLQVNKGCVNKHQAFDTLIAIFENEKYKNNDWIKKTLDVWQEFVSWMLPLSKNKAPEDEDEDLTLNQMQCVLKAWKKALAETSKTNSSSAAPSDATNPNESASGPSAPAASNAPTSDNTVPTSDPTTSSTKNDNTDSNQPSINVASSTPTSPS